MVPAEVYYIEGDDGLAQDWRADTVFINPPFSGLAGYLLYVSTGVSAGVELRAWHDDGLFYSGDGRDYYLLYRADCGVGAAGGGVCGGEVYRAAGAYGSGDNFLPDSL